MLLIFTSDSQSVLRTAAATAFACRARYLVPWHLANGVKELTGSLSKDLIVQCYPWIEELEIALRSQVSGESHVYNNTPSQPKPVFASSSLQVLANAVRHLELNQQLAIAPEHLVAGLLDFVDSKSLPDGATFLAKFG